MIDERPVRVGFIGCGAMARYHLDEMLGTGLAKVARARLTKVRSVQPMHVWQRILNARDGREPSPSPPEVGLRMARLWDAIQEPTARDGAVIRRPTGMAESAA